MLLPTTETAFKTGISAPNPPNFVSPDGLLFALFLYQLDWSLNERVNTIQFILG